MKGAVGQIQMSFGMIFSIILIIFFLAFAFYAIRIFLNTQNEAQIGKFINDLQTDIDRIWGGSVESSEEQEYFLPKKISSVCFVDGEENMIFYPIGSSSIESAKINNIDLYSITQNENPFCIEVIKGKLRLTLVKEFGGNGLVSIME